VIQQEAAARGGIVDGRGARVGRHEAIRVGRHRRQRGFAVEAEAQQPDAGSLVLPHVLLERGIAERGKAAPSHQYRDMLAAVDAVADRRRADAALDVAAPQLAAVARIEGAEQAIGRAVEHEVAGRRERAAVPDRRVVDLPARLLRDRVPGEQTTGRLIRIGLVLDVHSNSEKLVAERRGGQARVGARHVHRRDVREPGARAVGHRMPVVRAPGAGPLRELLIALRPRLGVLDRPAGRHVDAFGPVDLRILLGRQQLAGRAIDHVIEAVGRRLHQHLARRAVDLEVGEDDVGRGLVIPLFGGVHLVVPDVFAGVGLQRDDGRQEQVVALALAAAFVIPRVAVADAKVDLVELGVIDDGVPDRSAAAVLPPLP
jgi:hypothetical protein